MKETTQYIFVSINAVHRHDIVFFASTSVVYTCVKIASDGMAKAFRFLLRAKNRDLTFLGDVK